MILGIGIDLVFVPRLERIADRWEGRFLNRVFTERELADCLGRSRPYPSLAARFAAKEAFFKASALGLLSWKEIEVIRRAGGKPALRLTGRAAESHRNDRLHLALSHDGDYAMAQVVIEKKERSEG